MRSKRTVGVDALFACPPRALLQSTQDKETVFRLNAKFFNADQIVGGNAAANQEMVEIIGDGPRLQIVENWQSNFYTPGINHEAAGAVVHE